METLSISEALQYVVRRTDDPTPPDAIKLKTVQTPDKWDLHMWGAFCYQLPLSAKCSGAKSHLHYSSFDQHQKFQSTVELEQEQENELCEERKRDKREEGESCGA